MKFARSSGILLHPTALPGKYGIGTLGSEAFDFIDFLVQSMQNLWQVCPLGPTGYGDSPYQCFSAFAGNPLLINLEKLARQGLLTENDLNEHNIFEPGDIDFEKVICFKYPLLRKAFKTYKQYSPKKQQNRFSNFCKHNSDWLEDYALFMSVKEQFGGKPWIEWDNDIKLRKEAAISYYQHELAEEMQFHKFIQFLFFDQWLEVRSYANRNYINIIGDIPIFVAFDSADAWSNSEIFQFDENKNPEYVAGVPPDYFSSTGQLWGNPVYNWEYLRNTGFSWWIKNIRSKLKLYDIIRIDHFRGFAAYWAVPFNDETAERGTWMPALGKELFETIEHELGVLPIIAEDLGHITPDVYQLRDQFGFPGMKVLQFAFDSDEINQHAPHNFARNTVVYTGTHDNDTTMGWFEKAKKSDKELALSYFNSDGKEVHWDYIRNAWSSVAVMAIAPMQDFLGLGSEARFNTPGVLGGNWKWRLKEGMLKDDLADRIRFLSELYERA